MRVQRPLNIKCIIPTYLLPIYTVLNIDMHVVKCTYSYIGGQTVFTLNCFSMERFVIEFKINIIYISSDLLNDETHSTPTEQQSAYQLSPFLFLIALKSANVLHFDF